MRDTIRYREHPTHLEHGTDRERFNRILFSALDAIEDAGVPYAMIGGVAAKGFGRPRVTHDIDIFVRPDDADTALKALEGAGFQTEKRDPHWLFKAWKEGILVDIIFKSSPDIYFDDELRSRVRKVQYEGRELCSISPEDFVVIKVAVHREDCPHHWHDALSVLAHADIDWDYLAKRSRSAPRRLLSLLVYAQSNDILVPNGVISRIYETIFGDGRFPLHRPPGGTATKPAAVPAAPREAPRQPEIYVVGHVREALAAEGHTGEQDIHVEVDEGQLLLRGETPNAKLRDDIERIARGAAPGYRINNQLQVPEMPGPEGQEAVV